jgi:hypothetical protein
LVPERETPRTIWKPVAIVLAILLAVVLILASLVVAGIMDLGFSLM